MNYAVEMGSFAMTYTPNVLETGSDVQKLMGWGIHRHKDTQTAW
jgi:hypothetical protein